MSMKKKVCKRIFSFEKKVWFLNKVLLSKHLFFARRLDAFQEGFGVLVPCLEKKVIL